MDSGVAVRTPGIEGLCLPGGNTCVPCNVHTMSHMALEAQKGLPGVEQPCVYRTVRTVAVETVFLHVRMFIEEWPPLVGMTLETGLFDGILIQILAIKASVGVVAVDTEDPSLLEGVVARQGELGLGGMMAAETELARGEWCDL